MEENAQHRVKSLADIESIDTRDCDQVQSVWGNFNSQLTAMLWYSSYVCTGTTLLPARSTGTGGGFLLLNKLLVNRVTTHGRNDAQINLCAVDKH